MKFTTKALLGAASLALLSAAPALAESHGVAACLITKTDTNPFFVKMKEGAEAKAAELGVTLKSYAGKIDGDHESQVAAIESLHRRWRQGHPDHRVRHQGHRRQRCQTAREAGVLVIALDTPLDPIDAADATFATDNFQAGLLIGQWATATLGAEAANAKIAMLDLASSQPSVDVLRDQGFLQGFGIDLADPNKCGDENRSAHRRQRSHRRQRRRRPEGDGSPSCQGPGHQRRLHDQRAVGRRCLRGAEGRRQGRRADRFGRRRLPRRRRTSRTA